ncbi:cytosolic 5'-nucleotidase 1A isoform X2 [Oncorhynchus kisutch]|uniref:cytosolic 5'-nucleotidase 1A isoform X2 n=1 Tax=Oncorhynchus kisutch TaxID=8019 RepID=UPI00099FAEC5|nr:cytosolic 5'-nucleotidase 1A isoform X2 [Oncorhynchus kisutch]
MAESKTTDPAATEAGEEKDWTATKAFFDSLKTNKPRPPKPQYAVTIAVSSRSLFNMVAEGKIYKEDGVEKYVAYQQEHDNEPLMPGVAFPLVKALMNVNTRLRRLYPDSDELFDIVLMTNNHAQVGVRLINSINHYDLTIERFCMTGGESPIGYLKAYMTNLYLSKDGEQVIEAIEEGIAAATTFASRDVENQLSDTQLKVAFDGDAVLFSESEIIVKQHGLDTFFEHEKEFENKPLAQVFERSLKVFPGGAGDAPEEVLRQERAYDLPHSYLPSNIPQCSQLRGPRPQDTQELGPGDR